MRKPRVLLAVVAVLIVAGIALRGVLSGGASAPAAAPAGVDAVVEAFRERRSDVVVEVEGVVTRTLKDDTKGSRHQRFIVRLAPDLTVLVAHNIDLAPRVPLRVGDEVELRGEYEWNEKGGVIHWTHHDSKRRRPGGWIRHRGETYR